MDRIATPTDKAAATAIRAWLAEAGRAAGGHASILTTADVAPAIGFALGLALAVGALPRGLAAMAPGLILMLTAGVARAALGLAAARAGAEAARRIKTVIREGVVRAAFNARPGERPPVGEAMALVVEGVESLDGFYARFLPAGAAARIAPVVILAAMALASPVAALICAVTFIPFIAAMALAGGAAANEARRQFEALVRLSGLFADRVRALPAILAFRAQARTADDLGRQSEALSLRTLRVLRIAFMSIGALEFFAALSIALVAVYCGFNLLGLLPFPDPEHLDLPHALFVLALAPELFGPFRRLAAAYHDRQAAEAVAAPLMAASEPVLVDASPPEAPDARAPAIRFNGVEVIYPGAEFPALEDFSLEAGPGEVVAVMGATGCGKSTALKLLLGLAGATRGDIRVDGALFEPVRGLADRAAWAGQSPVVIPGTLYDNIALAHRTASADQVGEAALRAGLPAAALSRPIDERGGGLSGGELRRLALARVLLRDAPLLLLDEPTANLDARSEAELLPVIAAAVRGRTTLIATHSEALAAMADRIVRLAP